MSPCLNTLLIDSDSPLIYGSTTVAEYTEAPLSSVVRTLCTRAKSLSSSQEYFSKEMSYIRSVLSQNGYPKGFVKKAAKTSILSTPSVSHVSDTPIPATTVVCWNLGTFVVMTIH